MIVSQIPRGKVLSYSDVARLSGMKSPRPVGNILHQNKDPIKVPCHRVVHKDGALAKRYGLGGIKAQEERLEKEGVEVVNAMVDMKKYKMKKDLI